jgi:cysteine desulfurase / selenocysteine lyase
MQQAQFDVLKVRSRFPMLEQKMHGKPLIYLDSAATAHKPLAVIEAVQKFYAEQYGTVHRAVYDFAGMATAHYNAVRQQAKEFLNAFSAEEIIFTRGTTDAINLVAASYGRAFLEPGDEIIISEMEHHSNIVPWQMLCRERNLHLKAIPMDDRGELILDAYKKLLTSRTKLVSIAHIANSTGTLNPVEQIISMAHEIGAKVMIDGAQSAPHLLVDVQKLDVDFFAFSGHKAYGPTGIGILYGKKDLLEQMPPYQGGSDMIRTVTLQSSTYQPAPLKFEAGTPMIAEVMGLGAALSFIEDIGRDQISAWENDLLQYAAQKLAEIEELRIIGTADKKGAIITFTIKDLHPLDIGTLLDIRGIAVRTGHLCAQPVMHRFGISAATRISFGLYNTFEEIDRFTEALKEIIPLLK